MTPRRNLMALMGREDHWKEVVGLEGDRNSYPRKGGLARKDSKRRGYSGGEGSKGQITIELIQAWYGHHRHQLMIIKWYLS